MAQQPTPTSTRPGPFFESGRRKSSGKAAKLGVSSRLFGRRSFSRHPEDSHLRPQSSILELIQIRRSKPRSSGSHPNRSTGGQLLRSGERRGRVLGREARAVLRRSHGGPRKRWSLLATRSAPRQRGCRNKRWLEAKTTYVTYRGFSMKAVTRPEASSTTFSNGCPRAKTESLAVSSTAQLYDAIKQGNRRKIGRPSYLERAAEGG